ncbi:MAG: cobalt-precorrin-5B (C(1))-methyltransferase CbiD [Eubacteriales bacterium]|nr:cobalt-precorrin-5B (C(1))-methyltransferase CbiD [Eubacteriales bacterium]
MKSQRLRTGYTTGTCAAAAAKAAAAFVLSGTVPETVSLQLPSGQLCEFPVQQAFQEGGIWFAVKKDAGDDPDVTHGVLVYGQVKKISGAGEGYTYSEYPKLYLTGGAGIGLVTRPGLSCPVGYPAINPGPRAMIGAAVDQVCRDFGYEGGLQIRIAIPEGAALAEKTFNPRLGIEGGISVLGTTGIVKPMSEEAIRETIRLEIHMRIAAGGRILLMTPGNYGEEFCRKRLLVPVGQAVTCSNFVRDSVEMAIQEGMRQLLFISHLGKLVKVAAGMENTHSRYGDGRMEMMVRLLEEAAGEGGAPGAGSGQLRKLVAGSNTTDEAAAHIRDSGLAGQVLDLAALHAKQVMERWAKGRLQTEVITFSPSCERPGLTEGAGRLLKQWKLEQKRTGRTDFGENT